MAEHTWSRLKISDALEKKVTSDEVGTTYMLAADERRWVDGKQLKRWSEVYIKTKPSKWVFATAETDKAAHTKAAKSRRATNDHDLWCEIERARRYKYKLFKLS